MGAGSTVAFAPEYYDWPSCNLKAFTRALSGGLRVAWCFWHSAAAGSRHGNSLFFAMPSGTVHIFAARRCGKCRVHEMGKRFPMPRNVATETRFEVKSSLSSRTIAAFAGTGSTPCGAKTNLRHDFFWLEHRTASDAMICFPRLVGNAVANYFE